MKTWKHLNIEQRKIISSGLAHNDKLIEIAERLEMDPRGISREVRRNRISIKYPNGTISKCTKLNRWPLVCSNCKYRYSSKCNHVKYKYDAKTAQKKADANLINSRRGIDLDDEEFKELDSIIKKGIDDNKSIYQIKIENNDKIDKSITTIYRYINNGYLTTKRIDLPFAVKYKKRKHNKKYEYSENKEIDRTNHTYLDYLSYIHKNPRVNVWQLDFLGAIKTDSKNILSFILPVILTDRDPCFSDIEGICFSKITGEERCKLFFCDPYVSNQKPNVENINKQIRKFFPKGKSVDSLSKKEVLNKNIILLNTPIKSLDGNTPIDAFKVVYGEDLFYKIFGVVNDERK